MGGLKKYMPITYWTCADRLARADRLSGHVGLLLEGRADRSGARVAHSRRDVRLLVRVARRVRHRVLQLPPGVHDVPWPGALSAQRMACARASHAWRCHARDHGHDARTAMTITITATAVRRTKVRGSITLPLILLAIPSLVIGWFTIGPVLFGDYFGDAIFVLPAARRARPRRRGIPRRLARSCCTRFTQSAGLSGARSACAAAWFLYIKRPDLPGVDREQAVARSTSCSRTSSTSTRSIRPCSPAAAAASARRCGASAMSR